MLSDLMQHNLLFIFYNSIFCFGIHSEILVHVMYACEQNLKIANCEILSGYFQSLITGKSRLKLLI